MGRRWLDDAALELFRGSHLRGIGLNGATFNPGRQGECGEDPGRCWV